MKIMDFIQKGGQDEPKDRCVVIIGFQKSRSPLSNLFRGGGKINNYNNYNYNRVPGAAGGSKKNGSSNQRRQNQGREKRRPST